MSPCRPGFKEDPVPCWAQEPTAGVGEAKGQGQVLAGVFAEKVDWPLGVQWVLGDQDPLPLWESGEPSQGREDPSQVRIVREGSEVLKLAKCFSDHKETMGISDSPQVT